MFCSSPATQCQRVLATVCVYWCSDRLLLTDNSPNTVDHAPDRFTLNYYYYYYYYLANGVLLGGSGTTITHNTQNNTRR
jgi:hypothetical protein